MSDHLQDQLNELLSESTSSARERARTTFDRLSAPHGESLVLFGAGSLGRRTLGGLRGLGIEPLAFADNNPELWGRDVGGVVVLNPERAATEFSQDACFVTTTMRSVVEGLTSREMQTQLQRKAECVMIPAGALYWKYPDVFLPYYFLDRPHRVIEQRQSVEEAFSLWTDAFSRQLYFAQVRARLRLEIDSTAEIVDPDHGLARGLFALRPDEVFFDCGAFDGDSTRAFIERTASSFSFIGAFEPDPRSFAQLCEYAASLPESERSRIQLFNAAVGSKGGFVTFEAGAGESSAISGSGKTSVACIALDEYQGPRPTFVKMDIEGAELDALVGMQDLIRDARPVLAVSVYHTIDHLWNLPLFIRSLVEGYRFHLVAHNLASWDTVCYAVPEERTVQ